MKKGVTTVLIAVVTVLLCAAVARSQSAAPTKRPSDSDDPPGRVARLSSWISTRRKAALRRR